MLMTRRHSLVPPVAALLALALAPALGAWGQTAADKTIFVSVLDDTGKPVKDIGLGDILIREDGTDREVISISPAKDPLYVALLVDTTPAAEPYIQDIRRSLTAFVQQIAAASSDARISVTEFGQAAIPITPFTTDREKLLKDVNRIFPKRGDVPAVLLEGLKDASDSLAKQNSRRAAIVIFMMEGTLDRSSEEPKKIQESLSRSRAQLWTVSLEKNQAKQDRLSQRDVVLNAMTQATGGRREFISAESAIAGYMKMYADALLSQYAVTYKRPGSDRPKVVQTGLTRSGPLKLHSGLFAPQ
jgi:VWFA-related protein